MKDVPADFAGSLLRRTRPLGLPNRRHYVGVALQGTAGLLRRQTRNRFVRGHQRRAEVRERVGLCGLGKEFGEEGAGLLHTVMCGGKSCLSENRIGAEVRRMTRFSRSQLISANLGVIWQLSSPTLCSTRAPRNKERGSGRLDLPCSHQVDVCVVFGDLLPAFSS